MREQDSARNRTPRGECIRIAAASRRQRGGREEEHAREIDSLARGLALRGCSAEGMGMGRGRGEKPFQ